MQRIAMILTVLVSLAAAGCSSDAPTTPGGGSCPTGTPTTCGNGTIEAGEMCDQGNAAANIPANFANHTCASLNNLTTGPLQCGCCNLVTDMCVLTGPVGGNGG